MATRIGQYAPVFLPGEPPSLTEKPGRPQSTGLQRVGHYWSNPMCIEARLFFFACGSSGPVRVEHKGGTAAWLAGIRAVPSCRDMDCLRCRSYGPIRVFFHASCSWQSEGLFSQFLSVALQVQALRGLPCLRSFSVVWCVRHIEGAPGLGPTL